MILSQFVEFSEDDFMTLTFDELYEIIQNHRLNVPTEVYVLKVALNWETTVMATKLNWENFIAI